MSVKNVPLFVGEFAAFVSLGTKSECSTPRGDPLGSKRQAEIFECSVFSQDSEAKKTDKKDSNGPPLQTASVSVRALIEEKIIQKRITNPTLQTATTQANFTPATAAATAATSTQNGERKADVMWLHFFRQISRSFL